jgi:hypothetical protein
LQNDPTICLFILRKTVSLGRIKAALNDNYPMANNSGIENVWDIITIQNLIHSVS